MDNPIKTIDQYISQYPEDIQRALREIRKAICEAAPQATEKISWGMATFYFYGDLVHFSAHKNHIGFHPTPSAIEAFREEFAEFTYSKGTVQFPYDKPLPLELIKKMVAFRVAEQAALAEAKKSKSPINQADRPQRQRYPMPEDVNEALLRENLTAQYEARPPYQRNDYIGWIIQAKRTETRDKRLLQMMAELRGGDSYMGMPYQAKN